MAVKHYLDSLVCSSYVPAGSAVIDVGSGAGYPGIPLLVVKPSIRLTLLDSLQKRTNFLTSTLSELGLDARVVHLRAEDAGRGEMREAFDVVLSRAVAKLSVLVEYCLPLARKGGCFIAMKGPKAHRELEQAETAIKILGGKIEEVKELSLPYDAGARTLVILRKVARTSSKYPRRAGLPASQPL